MTVIATDGSPIEPIVVERIIALSGERFDVVLHAENDINLSKFSNCSEFFGFFSKNILKEIRFYSSFLKTKHWSQFVVWVYANAEKVKCKSLLELFMLTILKSMFGSTKTIVH